MLNFDLRCTGNGAYDRLLLSSDTLYVESGSLVKRRLGKGIIVGMYVVWSVVGVPESRFGAWKSGDQVAGKF